jgi:hypothetical protein
MDNQVTGILRGMNIIRRNLKRILTDAAGYALLLAAVLTGWLPGPGGVPLAIAGLGLLSINNAWAKRLRVWAVDHTGKLAEVLFPKNPWAEWAYDLLVILLLALTTALAWRHASFIQLSLSVSLFFIALLIALTNRDRLQRLKSKHKR